MEEKEITEIEHNFDGIKPYMKPAGMKAIEEQGFSVIDDEGDIVTPLIEGEECAYSIQEGESCWCAIEKAWANGKSKFRKPESCHLYPIRISRIGEYEALNYHKWDICSAARLKGYQGGIPVYRFLKEPLIVRYGEDWYSELEFVAKELEKEGLLANSK